MDRSHLLAQIPGLRRYARALTGNTWAADDLVQDTLERACSKWQLWTVGSDLRAWLFTVMHNLYASDMRRTLRRQQGGMPMDMLTVELAAPSDTTALGIDLQRCLLQLPEEQRTVLLLVSMEDMSYEQVARVTGSPLGTVMSRLSRARTRLQQLLDAPAVAPGTSVGQAGAAPMLRRLK